MKIYLVTDLEGVAGVCFWENRDDVSLENHERRCRQRRWLAEEKATLHELANQYGVSAERIRQLEQAALKKLRVSIAA